jgi:hypothetical protein
MSYEHGSPCQPAAADGLLKLGRIGGAMRIMAIRADELSFSERHMGRAIELRVSLQVTLAANFRTNPGP